MINLDQLRNLLGDEKLLIKYIALFKVSGPESLKTIEDAFHKKDPESLIIATHGLKTQFSYLGHEKAIQLTQYLENIESEKIIESNIEVKKVINSLSEILNITLQELDDYNTT